MLEWNYEQKYAVFSMPNYTKKVIKRYRHSTPRQTQDCPYQPVPRQYGSQSRILPQEDPGTLPDDNGEQYTRQVVEGLIYYARAIELAIIFALGEIAQKQANSTDNTIQCVKQLLSYMHSNPFAKIRFQAFDMILNTHSDASYISAGKGQSCAGGYFFLGSLPRNSESI